MRQMTWEDWNPYRGVGPRQILVALVICLFASLARELGRRFLRRQGDKRMEESQQGEGQLGEGHTGNPQRKGRWIWIGLTLFYIYTIVCATIFGRQVGNESEMRIRLLWTLEAALQTGEWIYWYYIVGNILMFIPLGFVLMHLLEGRKRRFSRWRILLWSVLLCLVLSLLIEGIQYVTGTGLCEVDDLLHNTLGGGIGGAVYMLLEWLRYIQQ